MGIVLNTSFNVASNSGVSGAYTFYIEAIEGEASVLTNKSPVTINVYAKGNNGFAYNGFSSPYIDIYLNGSSLGRTGVSAISTNKQRIASKTADVLHNNDGTKTISIQIKYKETATSYLPKPFDSDVYSAALSTIARASNLTLLYNSMVYGDEKEQVVSITSYTDTYYWRIRLLLNDVQVFNTAYHPASDTTYTGLTTTRLVSYLGETYSGTATFNVVIDTYTDSAGSVLIGSNEAYFTYTMGAIPLSLYQNGSVVGVTIGEEAKGDGFIVAGVKVDFTRATEVRGIYEEIKGTNIYGRKWANGFLEYFIDKYVPAGAYTSWQGHYYRDYNVSITFPTPFNSVQGAVAGYSNATCYSTQTRELNNTSAPLVRLMAFTNQSSLTGYVHIYIWGYWK